MLSSKNIKLARLYLLAILLSACAHTKIEPISSVKQASSQSQKGSSQKVLVPTPGAVATSSLATPSATTLATISPTPKTKAQGTALAKVDPSLPMWELNRSYHVGNSILKLRDKPVWLYSRYKSDGSPQRLPYMGTCTEEVPFEVFDFALRTFLEKEFEHWYLFEIDLKATESDPNKYQLSIAFIETSSDAERDALAKKINTKFGKDLKSLEFVGPPKETDQDSDEPIEGVVLHTNLATQS